jgi:hypothetical protein
MKPAENNAESLGSPAGGQDEVTGLPGLRTWRGVYIFVFGGFIVWVALLLVLTMIYS